MKYLRILGFALLVAGLSFSGRPAFSQFGGLGNIPVQSALIAAGNSGSAITGVPPQGHGTGESLAPTEGGLGEAQSINCGGCGCENAEHKNLRQTITDQEAATRKHTDDKFKEHQRWLTDDFYQQWVMTAMKMMAEQLVTNGMNQMLAVGSFLDAKDQLETQRLYQQHQAEARTDYQPTVDACVWGTAMEHITSTDRHATLAAHVLAKHGLDRQLGNDQSAAADGPEADANARLTFVRSLYCNPNDNAKEMTYICPNVGQSSMYINRDIDYSRYMGDSPTLNIDLTDTKLTGDEQDLLALQNYLYVNHPFSRLTMEQLKTQEGQEVWMLMRSVMAKHAVAENSFDNIMALKATAAPGNESNAQLISIIYQRMGLGDYDAQKMITGHDSGAGGNDSNDMSPPLDKPSYYALLQTLSQAVYQNPSFYVNLYDTSANIDRKNVAMQAIGLMVDRESFNSELREEGILSQILEAEVNKAQTRHEDAISRMKRNQSINQGQAQ